VRDGVHREIVRNPRTKRESKSVAAVSRN
jgi:hypothetical protein